VASVRLLVFIGPSGSGKSTVVRELHRRGVITVTPSWTTRPRRPDELEGSLEHRFVPEGEFAALDAAGFFLDTVTPFGLPHRYGLPAVDEPVDASVPAVMVRAPMVPLVARHFPDHVVYQVEDAYRRARVRVLAGRHESPADVGSRLDGFEEERHLGRGVAARVFVNATSPIALADAVAAAVRHDFARPDR
jgi:guanylate kinase